VLFALSLQPSVAARCPNKFVAARISMLQSEAQVLQFQRQFYEAALTQLRATPGYGSHARLQQHQEQHQQLKPQEQQHCLQEMQQCNQEDEQNVVQLGSTDLRMVQDAAADRRAGSGLQQDAGIDSASSEFEAAHQVHNGAARLLW
jgi:hypothetical protein